MSVKLPTIVGILIFMSRKNYFPGFAALEISEFLDIFILMRI